MEVCENCGKVIGLKETTCLYKTRVVCEPCHTELVVGTAGIMVKPKTEIVQANVVVPTGMYLGPQCQLCGHPMIPTAVGTHALLHLIAMICLFFFGLGIMFVLPVIGWLVGGTLVVVSLVKSNHRRKILMCRNCGAIADRK
jgi:hypothetical protein